MVATASAELLWETTLRICGTLDIEDALTNAFEYLRGHIPIRTMGLGFTDLEAARIHVVAKVASDGARFIWTEAASFIEMSQEHVSQSRQAPSGLGARLLNGPPPAHEPWSRAFPGLRTDSAIFVSLDMQGQNVGALLVSAPGLGSLSENHARVLASLREPFAIALMNARRHRELAALKDRLAEDNAALAVDIKQRIGGEVVGADFGLRGVMEQARLVAASNSPVLLLGETGTGKEVIANAIHAASPRGTGPMISMQCGAIPDTLLDSELFGHEKGAFTGASARKRGRFERAHGGTLFLDEVGELSPEAQVKLLRVLQEHQFERVGGTETLETDVRVIAATHRDLDAMVREGSFREDLWYRLNVFPLRIPPLRLRREDIASLVRYFVARKAKEMNLARVPSVHDRDLACLEQYEWPGNVRELQNLVERALILSRGECLEFPSLAVSGPPRKVRSSRAGGRVLTLDEAMEAHIRDVLERTDWQVAGRGGAAELLAMNPSTLRLRMKKLRIDRPR